MKIITIINPITNESTDFVIIDRGNEEFTSMPKSVYEAQQAEQSTPSVTNGD